MATVPKPSPCRCAELAVEVARLRESQAALAGAVERYQSKLRVIELAFGGAQEQGLLPATPEPTPEPVPPFPPLTLVR